MSDDETFLGRWSRRKAQARAEPQPLADPGAEQQRQSGIAPTEAGIERNDIDRNTAQRSAPAGQATTTGPLAHRDDASPAALAEQQVHAGQPHAGRPLPTLDSLRGLESEYGDFLKPDVAEDTRRAALKKLFADPHFNQMDRLDVYIDDYNQFEPMSAAVAASLAVYHRLSVFDHLASEQAKVREASDEIAQRPPAPDAGESAPDEAITASASTPTKSDSLSATPTAEAREGSPAASISVPEADGERDRGGPKHPQ